MTKMLDYLSIFKKLNENAIRYIVVGGIAVNLYGIPRMTYDIDLLLDFGEKNIKSFLNLVKSWGFKPKVPVNIMDFADKEKRENWMKYKNMKAFNLVNPEWAISEIDIITNTPVDYSNASKKVNLIVLQDISIPTISVDDLIKMKQKAGREQDKADIRYLKELKSEKE